MDKLDRKIVTLLQQNGRMSNAEISRELDVAPSTMLERIRRLEERGVLEGFRAVVNPDALGLKVQALVSVVLSRHARDTIKHFERDVQKLPQVVSCYHLTGRFDYMLRVVARDLEHLGETIKEKIASLDGISKAETFIVLSEVKRNGGYPIELAPSSEE